ncbi:O-antigen ligase family protein [Methylobacterium marchantiae]|uniref:O-antigen ligase family protein n=1 Tax=Methylobacterium marchantiae TaxID=600331 RepID=A0ABW3X3I9_9HYPH|nr:hypothetical protein AIGOOFII_3168 [Methylobacterium marchantiae]
MSLAARRSHADADASIGFNDRYLYALCLGLFGYAILGKGFAYLGVPPLFVGEILLSLGIVALMRSGCWVAILVPLQSQLLAILMLWVVVRTVPYLSELGLDAVRDSMIVLYGLFAFIVAALLVERPHRLSLVVSRYSRLAWLYGLLGGPLFVLTRMAGDGMPVWPGLGTQILQIRPGEAAVHVAGAAIFVLLGMRRVGLPWVAGLLLGIGLVTPSRGGMLACLVPLLFAAIIGRKLSRIIPAVALAVAIFGSLTAIGVDFTPPGVERSAGPAQIIDNIESILGTSKAYNLDDTKTWRLRWWQKIQDYTVHGPYFWTGKGFGINLAVDDDSVVGDGNGPALRSPHNANMTILARSGVPGLVLWATIGATWFARLMRDVLQARRDGDVAWSNLLLWIVSYASAIVIDASFDVALEGPMLGIWFWCLFGFGLGASMIYRVSPRAPCPFPFPAAQEHRPAFPSRGPVSQSPSPAMSPHAPGGVS